MSSDEIRQKFIEFFKKRGHAVIPSASLVPENDPSVLFTTAGMQPLVPYLLGQKHPAGDMLVNIQKCLRTGDLEDIGDNRHFSFFEMLGNWSLGAYFKKEAISWSYEFLTSKDEGLGLDIDRLYFTCFKGDSNAPEDSESAEIWKSLGVPESRIYFLGASDNWWSPGENGPCGPDTEMFYDMTKDGLGDMSEAEFVNAVAKEDVMEIWNDVFMEYEKKDGKVIGKLSMQNVDTGAGLERMTTVLQGKTSAYETDLFIPVIEYLKKIASVMDERSIRIVADHLRAAIFLISDGVLPSHKDRGYVLRRLIRRALVYMQKIGLSNTTEVVLEIVNIYLSKYQEAYPELKDAEMVPREIKKEIEKFSETLATGLHEFEKGTDPFILATTYGFPIELTQEIAKEKGRRIDLEDFHKKMEEHQKLSRTASAGMFKGGLANHNEQTIKLHTAHHLLLAALQKVLGPSVHQKGSNITEERLRIDFSFDRKMTDEEKKKVEEIVNDAIAKDYKVERKEMPKEEALKLGAEMEFGAKYGDIVSVYVIEDENGNHISKEFCGGPHVSRTGELAGSRDPERKSKDWFKIQKEEASSQGVRRIKAVLE